MSTEPSCHTPTSRRDSDASYQDGQNSKEEERAVESHQDVLEGRINPAKLTALLRQKFGAGAYEVQASFHASECKQLSVLTFF